MRTLDDLETQLVFGGDDADVCEAVGDVVASAAAAGTFAATSEASPIVQAGAATATYNVVQPLGEAACSSVADWSESTYNEFMRSIDIMSPQVFMMSAGSWY